MPKKFTLDECVYICMHKGDRWWTYWDLQQLIKEKTGVFYGEPSISASIRNLRKADRREKFGIDRDLNFDPCPKRRIVGGKGYEFRLLKNKENVNGYL